MSLRLDIGFSSLYQNLVSVADLYDRTFAIFVSLCMVEEEAADTLYNAILRIARNFLETRENIKILTHPFYHINLG